MAVYLGNFKVTVLGGSDGGGSGGEAKSVKDINFIDYDGTVVESYTVSEWANISSLPSNPSHTGLVAQGWNWTKTQIDTQLSSVGAPVWVGQAYITESGDTEIDIDLFDGTIAPTLGICPNGTVEIDWGDDSTINTVTGTSLSTIKNTAHTYAAVGKYTIKLHVVSGSFAIVGYSSSTTGSRLLWTGSNGYTNGNRAYQAAITAVRLGSGISSIGNYAFQYCYALRSITIPNGVTSIGNYAFQGLTLLKSITLPSGATSIGTNVFQGSGLQNMALPNSITSIDSSAFQNCNQLQGITIPAGLTTINSSMCQAACFLQSITIPSSVTSIGSSAFYNCYLVSEFHFRSTTPPTLANKNAFSGIPTYCKFYVPSASLDTYKAASNWSSYSSYMVGE